MSKRLLCCAVALLTGGGASAQGGSGLQEIVVTAQKREQSVFDVPITITAYTGEFLDALGIEDFDRLSNYVPGLVIQEQSPNNPGFVIRGITSDSGSAQIAPRVSVFQDGIDISRSRGSIVELYDLERIEVLKGPQATLFGTAASIGAISVISAAPTDRFEAELSGGIGNYGERRARGYVSGPLGTDAVRGRVAWLYRDRDGFIENLDGAPESQNPSPDGQAEPLNGKNTLALRGYLQADLSDALTLDLILNWQRDRPPGTAFKSGVFPPTGGDLSPYSFAELGPFGARGNDWLGGRLGLDRTVESYTARLTWDIDTAWQLTSITNYREFDSLEVFDADGTPAFWLEFAEDATGEQWSQELRLNYDDGGRLSSFFGATYFYEDGQQRVPFTTDEGVFAACLGIVPGLPCFNPDGSVNSIFPAPVIYEDAFANTGTNHVFSVYADATWAFTPQWSATVGLRYVTERRRSGFRAIGNPSQLSFVLPDEVLPAGSPLFTIFGTGNTGDVLLESPRESFSDVSPRLVIDYAPADALRLYGSIAKGRRSNVINVSGVPGPVANPTPVIEILPDEIIWSYEAGFKAELADGRLRLDGAVFYQDYSDFQTSIETEDGLLTTVNAGEATNVGVEASLAAQLTPGWSLFANGGYIDASFDDTDADGNPALFAGNRFRLQPTWTWAAGTRYEASLVPGIAGFVSLNWTYRSRVFFEEDNAPIAGVPIRQDNLHLVDGRIGFGADDGRWEVSAYANNLFDRNYLIDAGNTGGLFGTPTLIAGPPRFYGIEAKLRFGL